MAGFDHDRSINHFAEMSALAQWKNGRVQIRLKMFQVDKKRNLIRDCMHKWGDHTDR